MHSLNCNYNCNNNLESYNIIIQSLIFQDTKKRVHRTGQKFLTKKLTDSFTCVQRKLTDVLLPERARKRRTFANQATIGKPTDIDKGIILSPVT